jgi:hypothetical protein
MSNYLPGLADISNARINISSINYDGNFVCATRYINDLLVNSDINVKVV